MFLIDFIGYFGPFILILINIVNTNIYFFYLILFGNILNSFLNKILKNYFKIERQKQKTFMGNIEKSYAMPSGHSQVSTFNSTLLILIYKNIYLTLFSIILCVNTFYQRYNYRNHTLAQIIIGALIGIIFALLSYNIYIKIFIKKKLKKKKNNLNNK